MEMNGRNIQAMLKKIVALVLEVASAAQDSLWSALSYSTAAKFSHLLSVLLFYLANSCLLLPLNLKWKVVNFSIIVMIFTNGFASGVYARKFYND